MYPMKFRPVFQKRIWGGDRIAKMLEKEIPPKLAGEPIGESWELADLPAGTVKGDSAGAAADGSLASVITNGPLADKTLRDAMLDPAFGLPRGADGGHFPLLVKFLDAQQDLSVQVHPDEAYCRKHPGAHLKSEAWYILYAEPGARIYKGLRPGVTRGIFSDAVANGRVEAVINAVPVKQGDCHYLESGTVHALGSGILAAEVQTPSDTTFRVFDWNRVGADGKPRALHIEEALECINFDAAPAAPIKLLPNLPGVTRLCACPYFSMDRLNFRSGESVTLTENETRIWVVYSGRAVIHDGGEQQVTVTRGDTVLLPRTLEAAVAALSSFACLEVRLPS